MVLGGDGLVGVFLCLSSWTILDRLILASQLFLLLVSFSVILEMVDESKVWEAIVRESSEFWVI